MDTQRKVYEMLGSFDTAMLVTTSPEGRLESRPMWLAEVDPAGWIWLLTSVGSRKVDDVANDPDVLLICQDERRQYLSLRGRAHLVLDEARLHRIWRTTYDTLFPDGPDDSDIALLAIHPVSAEFWDNTGVSRLKHLWESAKILAGEPPDPTVDEAQHGRTKL
jgi:general stress protein 26